MKIATDLIIEKFPMLESYLNDNESTLLSDEALSKLSDVEQVFLRLAWFFENPYTENFNLESLYKKLDNDWLEFSLKVIHDFFHKDTFLIQDPTHSIITEDDAYLNQSRFATFLKENGLNYDNAKLSMYIKRQIVPEPNLVISGTKYWEKSTCESFLMDQLGKYTK